MSGDRGLLVMKRCDIFWLISHGLICVVQQGGSVWCSFDDSSYSVHLVPLNKKASTWEALVYSVIRNSNLTACRLAR